MQVRLADSGIIKLCISDKDIFHVFHTMHIESSSLLVYNYYDLIKLQLNIN